MGGESGFVAPGTGVFTLIAVTARRHGALVATLDLRDFQRIATAVRGLRLLPL